MKRPSLLLSSLIALTLVACSGSGNSGSACTQQYWDGTLGICLPENWEVMSQETLTQRGMPEEVLAAFQSEDEVAGQKPTVTVTRETLTSETDPVAYSKASIRSVGGLPAFNQLDRRKFTWNTFDIEIHIFTAQPLPDEPERKFYQLSVVNGNTGYTVTGFTPVTVSSGVENQVLTIIRSITFTDPNAAESN